MPEIALTDEEGEQLDITKGFNSSSYVVLPKCQAIRTPEMKQSGIVYTDVLTTSDKAYIKSNITENTTIDKQETDESGKFSVAVARTSPITRTWKTPPAYSSWATLTSWPARAISTTMTTPRC